MSRTPCIVNGEKKCGRCLVWKPATTDYFNDDSRGGLCHLCIPCRGEASRERYTNNLHEARTKARHASRQRYRKLRLDVLTYYSNGTLSCACCGEDIYEFLAVDHVNGDGHKHRQLMKASGARFYAWLKSNGFPKGFAVLCHNCNMAKAFYGECPHKRLSNGGYTKVQEQSVLEQQHVFIS